MTPPVSIGLPRMIMEPGERRAFLPDFAQFLTTLETSVFIEEGLGSRCGFAFDDYRQGNPAVHHCTREQAFQQDIVMVLRFPSKAELELLRPGAVLISMIHYPTRPRRVQILQQLGLRAISLDGIVNDNNLRLVENMRAVAWNGLEAAFDLLEARNGGLERDADRPYRALVLGSGMVGRYAVDAAVKLGNVERYNSHILAGGPGALALTVGRGITQHAGTMQELMARCDILIDATQRRDASLPVIPNDWLAWLPETAVIVDLAVDPYLLESDPPVVRAIEGIPQGDLDQYVFQPDDPLWDQLVPAAIPSSQRRTTISCYSWPGIHPEACMAHYGQQLQPLMAALLARGYERLRLEGEYFERALYRARLDTFLRHRPASHTQTIPAEPPVS